LDADEFLPHVARGYFGAVDASQVVAAWRLFGEAFLHYPFCFPMLYHSPFNYAPAGLSLLVTPRAFRKHPDTCRRSDARDATRT
jgi:hypothetical protein